MFEVERSETEFALFSEASGVESQDNISQRLFSLLHFLLRQKKVEEKSLKSDSRKASPLHVLTSVNFKETYLTIYSK